MSSDQKKANKIYWGHTEPFLLYICHGSKRLGNTPVRYSKAHTITERKPQQSDDPQGVGKSIKEKLPFNRKCIKKKKIYGLSSHCNIQIIFDVVSTFTPCVCHWSKSHTNNFVSPVL